MRKDRDNKKAPTSDAPPIRFGSSISRGKDEGQRGSSESLLFSNCTFPPVFLQAALSVLIKVVALTGLSAVIKGTVKKVSTGEITSSSGLMGSQFYQCTHVFS